jgi:hypothetical protein
LVLFHQTIAGPQPFQLHPRPRRHFSASSTPCPNKPMQRSKRPIWPRQT